jgi:hypothetical protein
MPKREWTEAERAEAAAKTKAAHEARRARAAEIEARDQRWGRTAPAQQEGIETVSQEPEEVVEELALTQEYSAPEPEPEAAGPEPTTPFDIYLSMLPPETLELLDMDELRKHFDDAEREAKSERRKQLAQQARDRAKESARAAAGLLTPEEVERRQVRERMSRRVKVTPTLPFVSDTGGVVAQGVTIDGVLYQNGQQATVPLGRALDMRHILYCLQQNELDFEGKGRLHGLRRQQAEGNNMVRI